MNENTHFSFTVKRLNDTTKKGTYTDTHKAANGLRLRIQVDGGAKSFFVIGRLSGKQITATLGKYPAVTIEQARQKARDIQTDLANGINPNLKKQFERTKTATLAQYFESYLMAKNLKPITIKGYRISFKNVLAPLASKELTAISYDDVLKLHKAYTNKSPAEADRAMRLLRAIFYMAMDDVKDLNGRPLILENPVRKLGKNKHFTRLERKVRKLEDDQLKPFIDFMETLATDERPFYQTGADLALILLYHGTRFTETAKMKLDQIDFKYKRFYLTETKNSRRLWLPMTSESEKVFKRRKRLSNGSPFIFPSATNEAKNLADIKKPLRQLLEQTGIEITPHDLRRTFLSTGARLGFNEYLLKQLANHATGNDITAGYVIQSADELKEPAQRITNAYLSKSGRTATDGDTLLKDLLSNLSETEKQQLLIRLINRKQA
jgi:integrase